MVSSISSRTPEGLPNQCPVCGANVCIEPSQPQGDAPCPNCGTLLWFFATSAGLRFYESKAVAKVREKLLQVISETLRVDDNLLTPSTSLSHGVGTDSLDVVELVMELEDEFDLPVSMDDAEKLKTIGDNIDYIVKKKLE